MIKMKGFALGICLSVVVSIGCSGPAANSGVVGTPAANANTPEPVPANTAAPVVAKTGKDLYTVNCLTCHKASGKGGKVTVDGKQLNPDDLTSANMKAKSDEKLTKYITDGIEDEGMPAFKDKMTAAEIAEVVKHVRVLQN